MIQEVKYNGFTQSPSDYICPDGDLDGAIGLVAEDNVLKPVQQPGLEFQLEAGQQVVYVHDPSYVHYIVKNSDNAFVWYVKNKGELVEDNLHDFEDNEVYQVTSVGNTLIVLASDGMHYFLWKADKGTRGGYEYLGTHLPELDLSFGLQGELVESEEFKPGGKTYNDRLVPLTGEEKTTVTNAILGQVNKLIAEKGTEVGKFVFPFLVRYAYRLYDGTLTMQSSPVLMLPSFGGTCPIVKWETYHQGPAKVSSFVHSLDYRVVRGKEKLQNWKDIVSSVDVFISAPFFLYDQSGQIEHLRGGLGYYSIHKLKDSEDTPDKGLYALDTSQEYGSHIGTSDILIRLPKKEITDSVKSCSTFFFLSSINIEDLATDRTVVKIGDKYLTDIERKEETSMGAIYAHETLPDDYDSHESIVTEFAYAFNARINLTGICKVIAPMGSPLSRFCFANAYLSLDQTPHLTTDTARLKVEVEHEGRTMVVESEEDVWPSGIQMPWYLSHSDGSTKYAYLIRSNITPSAIKFPMKRHELLNGAVHYNGDRYNFGEDYNDRFLFGIPEEEVQTTPAITSKNIIELPNKIYTSEINNPFYFPLTGINTVGTGKIMGICAATKALSQGQFGQFPLYAFTSEGVWALETTTAGTYSARQPITRDVCTDPESITQLDNSVLFATDRGVMMLSGSQSVCITDVLRSDERFDLEHDLPRLADVAGASLVPTVPFMEYLPGIKMLYDYNHQRIVMFNADHDYAYVYSLDSKMWGMMSSDLKSAVNSYPEALAMESDGRLVNFAKSAGGTVTALLVTRPLKLGAADIYKTIDTIIQRGHFKRGHVKTILYGSRDLFNWHLVYSSQDHNLRGFRGTPYKYFRIALMCELESGESLVGCSVQHTSRLVNQPR